MTLRFDGLYASEPRDNGDKSFSRVYLRFYADGCVIEQSVMEPSTAAQVARWFDRSKGGMPIGRFVVNGDRIAFHTVLEHGSDHPGEPAYPPTREDFEGSVDESELVLTCTRQSGKVIRNRAFKFSQA